MALDLDKLNDSSHLLDILIQCEDVLDSLDCYAYESWLDGEVVEGPVIRRHWVSISLFYPKEKMPDPRAALRLLKHGVMVKFDRVTRAASKTTEDTPISDTQDDNGEKNILDQKSSKEQDWLIKITIPRRLLAQIAEADLDTYEDDIEVDDVEDAKDSGLDDESAYKTYEDASTPAFDNPEGEENGFPN